MKHFKKIFEIAMSSESYSEYMMKMNLAGFSKAKAHGFLKLKYNCYHIVDIVKDGARRGEIKLKFLLNCI